MQQRHPDVVRTLAGALVIVERRLGLEVLSVAVGTHGLLADAVQCAQVEVTLAAVAKRLRAECAEKLL